MSQILSDLHDCGAIVCDGLLAIGIDHEQVTAIWAEGVLDGPLYGETGIDVGDDLTSTLRCICTWGRMSLIA